MEIKKQLDNIFKNQVVGSQVVIYNDGEVIKYNYGYSSLENKELIEDETIFRIASISKIIVAMAAMKLVEDGLLDLDEDLSNIFNFPIRNPKYPNIPLTTKMLMLHTSSINDGYFDDLKEHDNIGYNGVNGKSYFVDIKDLLTNTESKHYTSLTYSEHKPGENFIYSNFGTGLLACVVEAVSGELFTNYVEANILKPLNLDASFKASNIIKKDKISNTYYYSNEKEKFILARSAKSFIENTYKDFLLPNNFRGPAGGLFISMNDLVKIMQTLMNDGLYENKRILKKETIDLMLEMHYYGPKEDYKAKGLQLKFIYEFNGILLKGHTGSAYGVSSFMFFSKEANNGICFIANGGNYLKALPGLNNIQTVVLKTFVSKYNFQRTKIISEINIKSKKAYINSRKVNLTSLKINENEIYLNHLDIANTLNLIPKVEEDFIYFKNVATNKYEDISLIPLLEKLNIDYKLESNLLKIYL